jgi:hypothetical protein
MKRNSDYGNQLYLIIAVILLLCACTEINKHKKITCLLSYSEAEKKAINLNKNIFLIIDVWSSSSKLTPSLLENTVFIEKSDNYSVVEIFVDDVQFKKDSLQHFPFDVQMLLKRNITPIYAVLDKNGKIIRGPIEYSPVDSILKLFD